MPAPRFDPFDPDVSRTAWPLLAQLRSEAPVVEIGAGMRYVTTHDACRQAMRDTTSLSNANGMKAPGVTVAEPDRILGELDPPQHTTVRRVMVTALTPKVVHAAEPFIRATAIELLRDVDLPVDLVAAFTVPLPNRVTVHLLGFPPEDATQIAAWAKELMESGFPATNRSHRGEGFAAAFPDFAGYIDDQIERRAAAADPGDDIVSRLLRIEHDGVRLERRQVRALTRNLITGGLTTTSQLLGNLVHLLLTDRAVDAALRADPASIDRAVEESLRLEPPVLFVARGCTKDTEVAGCPVQQGERLIVGTASGNRDDAVFADPDRFDVGRSNAEAHLTFGYGSHVCPGAALARVEARIAIEAFLDRFGPGSIALEPGFAYEHVPTFFECGPRRLPVVPS